MDFVWIDGTGHGMTFYIPDEAQSKNTKTETKTVNKNYLYNSDFRTLNGENSFLGWEKTSESAPLEFVGQKSRESTNNAGVAKTNAIFKNYIDRDLDENTFVGLSQTSTKLRELVDNYYFDPGKSYTLSFDAKINEDRQNIDFVVIKETGRNLVINSDFTNNDYYWYTETTQELIDTSSAEISEEEEETTESVPIIFDEPTISTFPNNDKGWCGLTYNSSFIEQELRYNFLQNGSYFLSFDAFAEFSGGIIGTSISYYDKNDELIEEFTGSIDIAMEMNRYSIGLPYPNDKIASDIGGITIKFIRNDYLYNQSLTNDMDDETIVETTDYKLYFSNVKVEYNTEPSEWTASEETPIKIDPYSLSNNIVYNSDFSMPGSYWIEGTEDIEAAETNYLINTNLGEDPIFYYRLEPGKSIRQKLTKIPDINHGYGFSCKLYSPTSSRPQVDLKVDLIFHDKDISLYNTPKKVSQSFSVVIPSTSYDVNYRFSDFSEVSSWIVGGLSSTEMELTNTGNTTIYIGYISFKYWISAQHSLNWTPAPEDTGSEWRLETIEELDDVDLRYDKIIAKFKSGTTEFENVFQLNTTLSRYVAKYTFSSNINDFELYLGIPNNKTTNIEITNLKLEAGSKPTAWAVSDYEYDETREKNYANTWHDWGIVPTSRPVMSPPNPKTIYVDIPGANNKLDLTESLSGYVTYDSREGSFEFIMDPRRDWLETYTTIMNYLHGRRMDLVLDDDPKYYYSGRFSVNEWKSDQDRSLITIDYVVDAYKYELASSLDDWFWDPFNFETDVARDFVDISIKGTKTLNVGGSEMPVIPSFIVKSITNYLYVKWEGKKYALSLGTVHIPNIILTNTTMNKLVFEGEGKFSIAFKGGKL